MRVLPEFDAPAHVGNGWQFGEKEGERILWDVVKIIIPYCRVSKPARFGTAPTRIFR